MTEQWRSPAEQGTATFSNGNKTYTLDAFPLADGDVIADESHSVAGSYYVEYTCSAPSNAYGAVYISSTRDHYNNVNDVAFYERQTGDLYLRVAGTWTGPFSAATWTTGDVIAARVILNPTTGTVQFYKNNVAQGSALTWLLSDAFFGGVAAFNDGGTLNTGPTFAYTKPSGFTDWYVAGGGTQNLTPSLFTNSQTFYGPTITRGAVSLAPGLYTNTQSFFGPTVRAANQVSPARFDNSQTFYAPTVSAGSVALSPALFTNTNTFYSAVVSTVAYLAPALHTNTQTFYDPTVSPGAVTLAPDLFSNSQTFYGATVTQDGGAQVVLPDLYTNVQAFFSPTVTTGAVTLEPGLFTNTQVFFSPTVTDGSIPEPQPITSAGGYGTTYSRKTISRLAREAERARKAKKPRQAETIVAEAVATIFGGSIAVQQAVQQAIAEAPLAPAAPITTDIMASLIRQAQLILEQQDEEDAILLLMAA